MNREVVRPSVRGGCQRRQLPVLLRSGVRWPSIGLRLPRAGDVQDAMVPSVPSFSTLPTLWTSEAVGRAGIDGDPAALRGRGIFLVAPG